MANPGLAETSRPRSWGANTNSFTSRLYDGAELGEEEELKRGVDRGEMDDLHGI